MTEAAGTPQSVQTWRSDPALGDIYRLHIDGQPGYATALVDRNLPRSEQLRGLAELDWVPANPLSAVYDKTMAGTLGAPWTNGSFAGERLVTPFPGTLPVYVDVDDPVRRHPVADYLWPGVNPDLTPRLDPGEEIAHRWKMMIPSGVLLAPSGKVVGASLDPWPSTYLRDVTGYITTRRVVIVGRLQPPITQSGDWSLKLALVSPALDDLRASVLQYKRWRDRKNIAWCLHIRHEWLAGVEYGTVTPPGKKRRFFHSRADEDQRRGIVTLTTTWPSRARPTVTLTHVAGEDAPTPDDLFGALRAAVEQALPQVTFTDDGTRSAEIPGGMLLGRRDLQETRNYSVSGTVPYSLPASFS